MSELPVKDLLATRIVYVHLWGSVISWSCGASVIRLIMIKMCTCRICNCLKDI